MAEQEGRGEQPTPEQLVEEFKKLRVSDLLVSTVFTLSQIGYGKLDRATRDLEQAKLAIDALSALLPVLEPSVPAETMRDFNQVVANMKLAYASAASEQQPTEEQEPGGDG